MKIERLGNMVEGMYTPISIDGSVKHLEVKRSSKGLYIRVNKLNLYEKDIPIGEEVKV